MKCVESRLSFSRCVNGVELDFSISVALYRLTLPDVNDQVQPWLWARELGQTWRVSDSPMTNLKLVLRFFFVVTIKSTEDICEFIHRIHILAIL